MTAAGEAGRDYSFLDQVLINIDRGLRTVFGTPQATERTNPANDLPDAPLSDADRRVAIGLMRVNHAGEVSAQALYQGQALTARLPEVRGKMERAALEENDHLLWCEQRLDELGGRTSLLNPLWYGGSLVIGAVAGRAGDQWSLGFIVETERQVVRHLEKHLARLPVDDARSRAILVQMRADELHHATTALEAGAAELPAPVRVVMTLTSKVMTKTAYWL
jgi:3-demethoxyubiquinol 3-hydroxylase